MPTGIEYVDETYNPMSGCTKISEGCRICFAERMARRLAGRFGYPEAPDHFDVTLHPERLREPLRRRKPTRYLVCSMGDLFHADVETTFLQEVLSMMQTCNNHTFLVLTKRPERMAEFMDWWLSAYRIGEPGGLSIEQVLPNVWLGVTAENQAAADERIPILLSIPAAKHWVSLEPMLGPIDVSDYLGQLMGCAVHGLVGASGWTTMKTCGLCMEEQVISAGSAPLLIRGVSMGLDWVVLGGETGPGARPMHPEWARKVRDDCVAAGGDFFFKQWGEWAPEEAISENDRIVAGANDRWGTVGLDGRLWELTTPWTSIDLTTGEMTKDPEEVVMWRVGKKAAGRLLDGREWNEMPDDS